MGCSTAFVITCKLLSLKHKILRFSNPCTKCRRDLKIVIQYDIMHKENMTNCATVGAINIKLSELKGVVYAFTCGECDYSYI